MNLMRLSMESISSGLRNAAEREEMTLNDHAQSDMMPLIATDLSACLRAFTHRPDCERLAQANQAYGVTGRSDSYAWN